MKGGYNDQPAFWREVDEHEFAHGFMMYMLKPYEHRQMCRDSEGNNIDMITAKLWEFDYPGWEDMGFAISHDYWNKKIHFYKFGDPERWKKKQGQFAAQFAGDNS